ncbi:UNVERIFIED_CONTAM: hypothetical protein Sradi_6183200 [Sesamum radiatum]|uniref:Retrotransposon gag domain-containing protein n=1 Tax=Sesamum radiatum TaxID=300843 RepID=A0AAW2K8J4_SESRA
MEMKDNTFNSPTFKYHMSSLEVSSQHNNHVGASRDDAIALKFSLKLETKEEAQVVENDLLDDNMIYSSSTSSKAEIATVMMVQTTSLKQQIASMTAVVGNLLKYVQARDDHLNKLHKKFQSALVLNKFEEQDLSVECNTSKEISVSTNGFVSIKHVKRTVNEAIAKTYDTRIQAFKSYMKFTQEGLNNLECQKTNQPPKFQQFNGHGDPRHHIAHFVETCNNARTDGDLLVKQFVLSLKDIAFDCTQCTVSMTELANQHQGKDEPVLDYINNWRNLSLNCKDTLSEISAVELCIQGMHWELRHNLQAIKPKTFGELATRAHEIEMSFNCKDYDYLVDVSEDDATP